MPLSTPPLSAQANRLARAVFPSFSALTFNPVVRFLVDAMDAPARWIVPAYRTIPPNHLRLRIGSGHGVLANQVYYLMAAASFWHFAFARYGLTLKSSILDLGCGCGRYARHLHYLHVAGEQFEGRYVGVDIDEEAIAWCKSHFDDRFTFHISTDASSSYCHPHSKSDHTHVSYKIPEANEGFDLIFSASLFTHLLPDKLDNYLIETFRLLKPGAFAHHTFFLRDTIKADFNNGRQRFAHRVGDAYVESLRQPEAAVAYHGSYLSRAAAQAGFETIEIIPGRVQSILRLQR